MNSSCKINIKPTVSIGNIPSIVEKILPKIFDGDDVVLASESIVNDKKKFFSIRLRLVNILIPIVEQISRDKKESTLVLQMDDSGKLKIYQMTNNPNRHLSETPEEE
jgi:hypothetical protein